jgi:hypothetical protein
MDEMDINDEFDWSARSTSYDNGSTTAVSQVNDDGYATSAWFGEGPISEAVNTSALWDPFNLNAAMLARFFSAETIANAESFTITRGAGEQIVIDGEAVRSLAATLDYMNGSRTEVRAERPDPFGEIVVWEHTEYSPAGEVVSYSYGTTLRATANPSSSLGNGTSTPTASRRATGSRRSRSTIRTSPSPTT